MKSNFVVNYSQISPKISIFVPNNSASKNSLKMSSQIKSNYAQSQKVNVAKVLKLDRFSALLNSIFPTHTC